MKILVTGSTGFIGRRLTRKLLEAGNEITCVIRKESLEKARRMYADFPAVSFVTGDLTNNDVLDSVSEAQKIAAETEAVIHLAASYDLKVPPTEAYLSNVVGTQNLLYLLQRLKRLRIFHYMSSYSVSGIHDGEFLEEDLDPGKPFRDYYSQTKMQAELLVRNTRLPTVALRIYRPGIVIGDSKTGEMDKIDGPYYFFRLFQKVSGFGKHLPLGIVPVSYDAAATLPFLPVDILVDWMTKMITAPTDHMTRTYHLVPDEKIFVGPMIEEAAKLFGMNLRVQRVPIPGLMRKIFPLFEIPAEVDSYFLNHTRYSTANLRKDFPELKCPKVRDYFPKIVEGSRELIG